MLRALLSSRLIQAGLVFFVIVVGGSLLYSWHAQRTTETEFGKRPLAVVSLKNTQETSTAPVDFQTEGVTNTPEENTDTQMSESTAALPNETENLDLADAFLPDVEATLEEITDEEETAKEALSAEELRNKEGLAHLKKVLSRLDELTAREGGKIDHTSSLSARVEMYHLLQELYHIMEEEADNIPLAFKIFMNMSLRGAKATAAGGYDVSDYLDVAGYIEAEGNVETANQMRAVAQRALDNGDDIIKPEHFKVAP